MRVGFITHLIGISLLFGWAGVQPVRAINLALNASFEEEILSGDGVKRNAAIANWTKAIGSGGPGLVRSPLAADAGQYAMFFGPGRDALVLQTLNQTITSAANQTVQISFSLRGGGQNDWSGGNPFTGFSGNWLGSSSGATGSWVGSSANLTFRVAVNGSPLAQVVDPGTGAWQSYSFVFNSTGSDLVELVNLGDAGASGNFTLVALDALSVQVIPEPGAVGLMGAGLVGWVMRRRRGDRPGS